MDQEGRLCVGIRGAGQVANQHAAAILANPRLRLAAISSRSRSSSEKLGRNWASAGKAGKPIRVYDRYEELLDDQTVDIVSECMPNYLHAGEAILAFNAGKHLILEKPAGISREELQALRDAAGRSGRKSVVSFVLRWHPLVANLKNLLDASAIGDVYYAEMDYWHGIKPSFSSYDWIRRKEYAGGAMITGGCHATDLARYLHGEIDEVSAYATRVREDFDYPTTIVAALRFADGSVGKISVSLDGLNFPYQFNIDLLGTKGALRDNRIYSKRLFPAQKDFVVLPCDTPNSGSVEHHPFKQEIDNLVECIDKGAPVLSDVADACESMEVALAITESAASGKPVKVHGS
ncbi:MAG: Gfo/Idh/MocA family oxidoreductase [Spirochaetia bacterium]|nr:Gfo/Idh/MocA family oxidoreductase [Spirochaetia bacterium]